MDTKYAFVTGANRGIGFETARQLARQDTIVFLGSRNETKGQKAAQTLKEEGLKNIQVVPIDISKKETIRKARDIIESEAGRLDILINNAGILGETPQDKASEFGIDKYKEIFDVNFFGTIQTTQLLLPLVKRSPEPVVLNITSGLSSLTKQQNKVLDHDMYAGYGPSKVALNGYTAILAKEMRMNDESIRVNVVNPGFTATDFNDYQGTKDVEDAAASIVKYALMGADAPNGAFISEDDDNERSPW
jgi:NAD(P)-dependent dehydrogenase (short-subunit alcohol dehydrogenase family)